MAESLQETEAGEITSLKRRLARERSLRQEAEALAKNGFQELYRQRQHLKLLEAVAAAANQSSSVHEVLRFAVNQICDFGDWPVGHAYLAETGSDICLRSTPIWHLDQPARMQEFRDVSDRFEYRSGEGVLGLVLASGRAVWRNGSGDPAAHPAPRLQAARACGLQTIIAFPVLVGKSVAAVLEFFAEQPLEPDQAVLRLFSQIGTQLGRVVERKRAEDLLLHDSLHDPLTGLPNRALFRAQLNQLIGRNARWQGYNFALLFLDLDRFKVVNDGLGHATGDRLLTQVAARILGTLREQEISVRSVSASGQNALARLGGDEFTILLEDIAGPEAAMRVGNQVLESLKPPFEVDGREVYMSASVGIANSGSRYASGDDMLRDANLAMYRAKAQGRSRCEAFDRSLHAVASRRLSLETDLRRALGNDEFVLHYQPIVALASGELTGFEALVRWQHPKLGLVYPNDFITLAEDTGLILPLGAWVLGEACRTMHQWQQAHPRAKPLTISVNVTAREFTQPDQAARIGTVLGSTGIAAETVRLEITESVTMGDSERTVEVLCALRALGVRLSIDDFGTGFSSLSYLHRFPFDVLKIDRSFVMKMETDGDGAQIVRTILALARSMNMEVVAEGTESAAHVSLLRAMGCDYAQGYFYSKPVDAARALLMLQPGGLEALAR